MKLKSEIKYHSVLVNNALKYNCTVCEVNCRYPIYGTPQFYTYILIRKISQRITNGMM